MISKRFLGCFAATLVAATLIASTQSPARADSTLGVRFVLAQGTQKTIPQNGSFLITRATGLNGGECQFHLTGPSGASFNYAAGADVRGLVLTQLETISNNGTTDCAFSGIFFVGPAPGVLQNFLTGS